MGNLIEGILGQCNRNRELLSEYEKIGPAGIFGAHFIKAAIEEGEAAMASGDTVRMLRAYKELEGTK